MKKDKEIRVGVVTIKKVKIKQKSMIRSHGELKVEIDATIFGLDELDLVDSRIRKEIVSELEYKIHGIKLGGDKDD